MAVWTIIVAVVVVALLTAWVYDRRHPGAMRNRSGAEIQSQITTADRRAYGKSLFDRSGPGSRRSPHTAPKDGRG